MGSLSHGLERLDLITFLVCSRGLRIENKRDCQKSLNIVVESEYGHGSSKTWETAVRVADCLKSRTGQGSGQEVTYFDPFYLTHC